MTKIEITSIIEKLLSQTKENKIDWKYLNQNIVRWIGGNPPAYLTTIQKSPLSIVNNVPAFQYSLIIQKMPTNELILQLISNPNTEPNYIPLLKELFEIVIEKTQTVSLNNFNNYLNNL